MTRLCWNAIVKNEDARIERCVNSLLPHIDCAVVVDTGSTDQTLTKLSELFKQAGKPLEIHHAPFENFAQARNVALNRARDSKLAWDYLLLADADMELKVEKKDWINGHDGLSYSMKQLSGALGYHNVRLVSRLVSGNYVGVTHEYIDVTGAGFIDGAYFLDHADGANRPDKFKRDIRLIKAALKTEQSPGLIQRYHFYLAQSYFDSENWQKAADHYKKRVELGGWDEEVWNAQLHYAHCLGNMGDYKGFVWECLRAYDMRPSRAETLCDLARYFREHAHNHISLLFSVPGMLKPRPKDMLFVAEDCYTTTIKEEFAICAYYDASLRKNGAMVANSLALNGSQQARFNLFWYLKPLSDHVPSFNPEKINFTPPEGYVAMNPSLTDHGLLVRTVNYTITDDGHYRIRASDGSISGDYPIHTRNFIHTDDGWGEIELPTNLPAPAFDLVLGFEDSRLFEWRQGFWTLSTVRQLNHEGMCEQVLAPVLRDGNRWRYGPDWQRLQSPHQVHEKNWMPWVDGEQLSFVYRLGTLLDSKGETTLAHNVPWDVARISGGSQVVKIDDGFIAIVHEAGQIPGRPNRYYQHRFVLFDADNKPSHISLPFFFHGKEIEFAAGLVFNPEKRQLTVSYGRRDCEAWTATMDADEVVRFAQGA
jgi:glycosyltransferase involved in cell wall biosynthesis